MQRKVNMLMVLFSLIGGLIGFMVGEWLLHSLLGQWPRVVVVGLYFGIVAFFIGLFCLIAEMISPRLSGASWRQRYVGHSWKFLVPATLIMLFIAGLTLEFVHQLDLGGSRPVKDITLVIDNSGSMRDTDPANDRYKAAKQMIGEMDSEKKVAVIVFNDKADLLQPYIQVKDQAAKESIYNKIDALKPTEGGTDIGLSLSEAMKHIKDNDTAGRGTMVVLLSDGFSEMNTGEALAEYQRQGIAVHTIGLSLVDAKGAGLLQDIANQSGGQYYDVTKADELSFVFEQIYNKIGERTLITERTGPLKDSGYYTALRVAALVLIGAALGLALGLVFDNRHLARSFAIGGAVAGLMSGILLEAGLTGQPFNDAVIRLLADLILACVITLFTLVVPVQENLRLREGRQRPGSTGRSGGSFAARQQESRNKGF
ncbi:vWA domain-containing protein [Paenibacillus taiwanensis]|uniref:vWA domain-containing protein n=1 Tax=Paenibacillus taiwanensis TaxID=401638 RepID=UPI0004205B51|nr:vWA domain-containing protein [Paenibacillus taiwanensis]